MSNWNKHEFPNQNVNLGLWAVDFILLLGNRESHGSINDQIKREEENWKEEKKKIDFLKFTI